MTDALDALRARRRGNRTAGIDPFDAFYQAYITALLAGAAVLVGAGWLGDEPVSIGTGRLAHDGAAVLAVVAAVTVSVGLRSGARGGPFAVEAPDVRHVLLAPVDRDVALRASARRQLRSLSAAAAVVGAVGGVLAAHRLPAGTAPWAAAGAMFGVVTAAVALGVAWVAAGTRLPPALATAGSAVLIGGTVLAARADVAGPATWLGEIAVLPLRASVLAVAAAVALALIALVAGARLLGGASLERLARRSSLIGELRFAATMRDLRTVMVLRRQLTQELPRSRPWIPLPGLGALPPVVRRDVRSLLRMPPSRALRLAGALATAALSGVAVWHGTTAMVVVGGLAGFVAGLELLEPLAQELDHPQLLDLAPLAPGPVHALHLAVPVVVLSASGLAVAVPLGLLAGGDSLALACVTAVSIAATATAGAAGSILRDSTPGAVAIDELLIPPEAVGMRMVFKTFWPPALAAAGFLPLLAARSAETAGLDPVAATSTPATLVLAGAAAFAWWVRSRDDLRSRWAQTTATPEG